MSFPSGAQEDEAMLKGQRSYPAVRLAATVPDLVTVPAIQALRSRGCRTVGRL